MLLGIALHEGRAAVPSVNPSEYAQYLFDLISTPAAMASTGLKSVFYGDQQKLAFTPIACVEPGLKRRSANGAPRRYMNDIDTHIIVYHGAVQSTGVNMKVTDQIVEKLEVLIHADATFGGLCIDSFVREVEPGYQTRGTSLYRASMLTVEARQQELLPLNF